MVRMEYSCQGTDANANSSDTALRSPSAATSPRFAPTRSASHPAAGFNATFTIPVTAIRAPVSVNDSPRRRAYRGSVNEMMPNARRMRNPSTTRVRSTRFGLFIRGMPRHAGGLGVG